MGFVPELIVLEADRVGATSSGTETTPLLSSDRAFLEGRSMRVVSSASESDDESELEDDEGDFFLAIANF